MRDVFSTGSPQLCPDRTVELLKCIIKTADRPLTWVLLAAWIPSFLSLNSDGIGVVDHAPGSNLDTFAANEAQLLGQGAELFLRLIKLGAAPILIGGPPEPLRMVAQASCGRHEVRAAL